MHIYIYIGRCCAATPLLRVLVLVDGVFPGLFGVLDTPLMGAVVGRPFPCILMK